MMYVTVGSQKFQFNRLLKAIDELVKNEMITDTVFAQTGYCDYKPMYYEYKPFLDRDEFDEMESKADIIITHGGTGAIVGAVKKGKKVIAVARLAVFGEHVDNHQLQIIKQFVERNLIMQCSDLNCLDSVIREALNHKFDSYTSNTFAYLTSITNFIDIL